MHWHPPLSAWKRQPIITKRMLFTHWPSKTKSCKSWTNTGKRRRANELSVRILMSCTDKRSNQRHSANSCSTGTIGVWNRRAWIEHSTTTKRTASVKDSEPPSLPWSSTLSTANSFRAPHYISQATSYSRCLQLSRCTKTLLSRSGTLTSLWQASIPASSPRKLSEFCSATGGTRRSSGRMLWAWCTLTISEKSSTLSSMSQTRRKSLSRWGTQVRYMRVVYGSDTRSPKWWEPSGEISQGRKSRSTMKPVKNYASATICSLANVLATTSSSLRPTGHCGGRCRRRS